MVSDIYKALNVGYFTENIPLALIYNALEYLIAIGIIDPQIQF